ncbi:pyridoxamine 5'-phosphate oxidase family protein [Pseudofrankia inefficax]|uniref:Pyridoxamine 5'-phosphate oxidase-related FMN-binding protein n=1 Tax=Pseudofrankia inefficax (strain DSM 45817 / CECT 9037 / DDB 130130 / EuI1c) TaxID=298654 RepID=E3J9Y1_PSEI1|nr:pyridoxamine 5'-phosphate oxidase family protein [Pseudofrankia inefficax]ADP78543.1 pyridoxamine 5'-phosphate oxidase-related FMN-binding protein [Pseudofrankia inefficax]
MTTPTTRLDRPYSAPSAVAVSWEQAEAVLRDAELSWISTVRPDGGPHVTPLVAVWLDGALYFHTGAQEQKYANLRANPRVVLTTGAATWDHGIDVVVEGEAVPATDEAILTRLAAAFATKWDGRWRLSARDGHLVNADMGGVSEAFEVRPTRAYAHTKGEPFSQTTYTF